MNFLYSILALLAIFILSFGVTFFLISGFASQRRIRFRLSKVQVDSSEKRKKSYPFVRIFLDVLDKLTEFSSPKKQQQQEGYKKKFVTAGIKGSVWTTRFFGLKTFFTFVVPLVYVLFAYTFTADMQGSDMLIIALTLAILGYYLPNAYLSSKVKSRKQEIFDAFPDLLDLIRVCVAAGMGLDAAMHRVSNEIKVSSIATAEELSQLNLELRAGASRASALQNFSVRCDLEEVRAFVAMIIQAERHGTSVSAALLIFSEDLRAKRKLYAQEIAAKIPVKLSLPIMICIFPAIFVVMLAPPLSSVMTVIK